MRRKIKGLPGYLAKLRSIIDETEGGGPQTTADLAAELGVKVTTVRSYLTRLGKLKEVPLEVLFDYGRTQYVIRPDENTQSSCQGYSSQAPP